MLYIDWLMLSISILISVVLLQMYNRIAVPVKYFKILLLFTALLVWILNVMISFDIIV